MSEKESKVTVAKQNAPKHDTSSKSGAASSSGTGKSGTADSGGSSSKSDEGTAALVEQVPYGVSADFDLSEFKKQMEMQKDADDADTPAKAGSSSSDKGKGKASASDADDKVAMGLPAPQPHMRVSGEPVTRVAAQPVDTTPSVTAANENKKDESK
jgi:hypothetical protein